MGLRKIWTLGVVSKTAFRFSSWPAWLSMDMISLLDGSALRSYVVGSVLGFCELKCSDVCVIRTRYRSWQHCYIQLSVR